MKKNEAKKLQLSRETLRELTRPGAENVVGGTIITDSSVTSCESACILCKTTTG